MPAWTPPTKAAQRAAMSSQTVPKDLAPWLRPEIYPAIAEPDEDDWPRGSGQSFEKYVASKPRRPIGNGGGASNNRSAPLRNKIYLQPLGDAASAASFPCLATLARGCEAFYGLECRVLPMMSLAELEAAARRRTLIRTRGGKKRQQVNAADINNNLREVPKPADCFTFCAVTMHDLWKGDFNYLFGLAFFAAHVGVFSFYRHQPHVPECEFHHGQLSQQPGDADVLLRRGFATLTHELGHTFGLKHCVLFSCLMQGANSLEEAEGRMPDLCPICLRKLLWCSGAESCAAVRARYERLRNFFAAHPRSFGKHLAWVETRLVNDDGSAPICLPCDDEGEAGDEAQPPPAQESGAARGAEPAKANAARTAAGHEEEECGESGGSGAAPPGVARLCSQDVPAEPAAATGATSGSGKALAPQRLPSHDPALLSGAYGQALKARMQALQQQLDQLHDFSAGSVSLVVT